MVTSEEYVNRIKQLTENLTTALHHWALSTGASGAEMYWIVMDMAIKCGLTLGKSAREIEADFNKLMDCYITHEQTVVSLASEAN